MDLKEQLLWQDYWNMAYLGNPLRDYVWAVIVFIGLLIIFKIFQAIILIRLKSLAEKTKTDLDDTAIKIVRSVKPPFYFFLVAFLTVRVLETSELFSKIINSLIILWLTYQIIVSIEILIDYVFNKHVAEEDAEGTKGAIKTIQNVIKGILWVVGILFVLQNFGIEVTSLVAGLGIGGIAIALAAQNVLGDLFSSFAILFDKPFLPGHMIVVGDKQGTVEKIGIKTTRIRSVDGEEIILSNQELTNSQILNYKRMNERRMKMTLGVVYETPSKSLKKIPAIIKSVIKSEKLARLERVHFKEFGDSSLNFEIVYFVKSKSYRKFLDVAQRINYKLVAEFEKEKVDFAYPTKTVYFHKND